MSAVATLWLFEATTVQACITGATVAHVARHRAEVAQSWTEGCEQVAVWWAAVCRAGLASWLLVLRLALPPHGTHRRTGVA